MIPDSNTERRKDHGFYIGLSMMIAGMVFFGFAKTFFLRPHFTPAPLEILLAIHGTIFTLWIVLLVVQTALISSRRVKLHQQLGTVGAVLAALMIVLGIVTAVHAARRDPTDAQLKFMATPFTDIAVFSVLIAAGISYRKKPEIHKRLMLLGTASILAPATARFPFHLTGSGGPMEYFLSADIPIAAVFAFDFYRRRSIHSSSLWAGALIVTSQPVRLIAANTALWMTAARWIAVR